MNNICVHDEKTKPFRSRNKNKLKTLIRFFVCVCTGSPQRRNAMALADLVWERFPELRRNVHGHGITPLASRNPKPPESARNMPQGQGRTVQGKASRFKRRRLKARGTMHPTIKCPHAKESLSLERRSVCCIKLSPG